MMLYGTWQVTTAEGESYKWAPDEVLPDEELVILNECGADTYEEWISAVDRREAVATQTLIWWLQRKSGKRPEGRNNVIVQHRKVEVERIEEPPPVEGDGRPES